MHGVPSSHMVVRLGPLPAERVLSLGFTGRLVPLTRQPGVGDGVGCGCWAGNCPGLPDTHHLKHLFRLPGDCGGQLAGYLTN